MPEPGRRRETLLDDLPEEIVVDQILIRLPSKDVGRCRAVSTSWRSATSTPEFMLQHHRRQPSLPIGTGWPNNHFVLAAAGAGSQQLWPFVPRDKHTENRLHSACDGFLIVRRRCQYYIYNPVTRKHALLPMPPVGQCIRNTPIGFYRHYPTGEFRVLWASVSHHLPHSSLLYVLTVGSDKPRYITVRMPTISPPSPSVEHDLLRCLCDSSPPAHHRGSLHWCPFGGASNITGGTGDIIVFDTEAESFRWMHSPQSWPNKLFNMKGMLAFCAGSADSFNGIDIMDIWVMQDYEAEIWAFKYRIDVSMVEASRQLYLSSSKNEKETTVDSTVHGFNDMAMLNERELLIMFNERHVFRCDIDGKFLGMVNTGEGQNYMELTHHRLQESIIPIPSHEMQGEDEGLPFSTGHLCSGLLV